MFIEDESVIDHQLTFERIQNLKVSTSKPTQDTFSKAQSPKNMLQHVVNVEKGGTTIRLNTQKNDSCFLDELSELDVTVHNINLEEKVNYFIFRDEKPIIRAKIVKVTNYWNKLSLIIPNIFRMLRFYKEDSDNYTEFQDYSHKELLVQISELRVKLSNDKRKIIRKSKRTS